MNLLKQINTVKCCLFITLILVMACSSKQEKEKTIGLHQSNILKAPDSYIDSLLLDTPKVLKVGRDYVTVATKPLDWIYFGEKFAPYKIETYHIAVIERVIDSLMNSKKQYGLFKNKNLNSYKYQIFSVRTTEQKLYVRVKAICIEEADHFKWNSSIVEVKDGGECFFNIIYNLSDSIVIMFEINGEA